VFGYKTAFAYFNAFDEGLIDESAVQNNVGIYIGCGNFSYAAIPNDFDLIMGVSGTIHCLSPKEKEIIQQYGISRLAFTPSMYATAEELNSVGANNKIITIIIIITTIIIITKRKIDDLIQKKMWRF
jgi:hypothetical protein